MSMSMSNIETATNGVGVPATRLVNFGDALKVARESEGLSRADMGELAGVTGSAIEQVENGHSRPSIELHARLVEVLPALKDAPKPRKMKHSPRKPAAAAQAGDDAVYAKAMMDLRSASELKKRADARLATARAAVEAAHSKMLAAFGGVE